MKKLKFQQKKRKNYTTDKPHRVAIIIEELASQKLSYIMLFTCQEIYICGRVMVNKMKTEKQKNLQFMKICTLTYENINLYLCCTQEHRCWTQDPS